MQKGFCMVVILLILVPASVFSQATYDARKKLLSVKSEGTLLSELLSAVSAETGIDVYISPAVDKKVFIDIESQPLEDAIKRVIKPLNNAIVFKGNSIEAVKIFEKCDVKSSVKIPPEGTYSKSTSPSPDQINPSQGYVERGKGWQKVIGHTIKNKSQKLQHQLESEKNRENP